MVVVAVLVVLVVASCSLLLVPDPVPAPVSLTRAWPVRSLAGFLAGPPPPPGQLVWQSMLRNVAVSLPLFGSVALRQI